MTDDINNIPSSSPNLRTELARQLQELVPESITDGKVDIVKLKELLDDDVRDDTERFGLFWPGKKRALRAAQEPTTATLRPMPDQSKDWDTTQNVFIEGDNLEVLKILQKRYHNSVRVIYIDPPYNTGGDFIYPDNYQEGLQSYLEFTEQVDEGGKKLSSNAETDGRFHSNWLNMIYPRLKLARNLLTDDGVIFISIDDNEHANLVQVVKEIFGDGNYLGSVARIAKKTSNKGTHFAPSKDYVVVAGRGVASLPPLMDEVSDAYRGKFSESDSRGAFATVGLYQASLDPLRGCSNQRYWIECPDGTFVLPPGPNRPTRVADASNRSPESAADKVWRWSYESYLAKKDLLVFKQTASSPLQDQFGGPAKWNVYTKYYLADRLADGIRPRDFLDGFTNDLGARALKQLGLDGLFDFTKPPELIQKLLSWLADSDGLVLDFFAGSGTTAQAVMQINRMDGGKRRFILVQLPEPTNPGSAAANAGFSTISGLARHRVDLAGRSIAGAAASQLDGEPTTIDVGFRAYALCESQFKKWRVSSDIQTSELGQHLLQLRDSSDDAATVDELLVEVLIKQGFSLSEAVTTVQVSGLSAHSVGGGALLAYMDEHTKPTLDQLRALLELGPAKLIILEDAFQGDDELKTNLKQICKAKQVELWTA